MKNVISILLLSLIGVGCGQNREEKAALFAENEVKKILNDASSYEAVETKLDSAFTSIYTDYEACSAAYKITELRSKQEALQDEYDREKSTAALWSNSWSTYSKEQYRQAKNEMEKIGNRLKKVNEEIKGNEEIIKNRNTALVEKKFCGWAIYHRFRCANRLGIKSLADILLVTDENFESLKIRLMLDNNDPQGFKQIKQTIDGIIEK